MSLGSYGTWASWCRDPLLTLGCPDPVPRLHQEKDRDPERGAIKDVFASWWEHHQDNWVRVSDLNEAVKPAICALDGADPTRAIQNRQYIARRVVELDGTEIAEFKLNRCQDPKHLGTSSDWGYRLTRTA